MKVEVTQENLHAGLSIVGRVAGVRTTLPILANILISTDGKQLRLAATNLEIGIVHHIGAKITEAGSLTVPARLMHEFIASLPPSNVSLETDGQKLLIKASQFESTINGIASDEFPSIPEIKSEHHLTLPASEFKTALNQTIFAASSDETRPVLTAVYMYRTNPAICLAATDSYRLAERKLTPAAKSPEQPKLLIPARSLNEIQRIIDERGETIELSWDDAQTQLKYGKTTIVSRLIDGAYPAYQDLLPKESEITFTINREELLRVTKVASLFAREFKSE